METKNNLNKANNSVVTNEKVLFLKIFSWLGIVIGLILVIEDMFSQNFLTLYVTLIFLGVLMLNLLQVQIFKLHKLGSITAITAFASIIIFLLVYGDGNMFIWIGPFGAATFFLMGSRKGFYITMSLFILVAMGILANTLYILEIPFPNSMREFAPDFVASTILLFLFILIFQENVETKEKKIDGYLKQLELEHRKDRSIFSTIETGLVTANEDRIITFINEPGYKLLRAIPEEIVGKHIDELFKFEKNGKPIDEKDNPLKQPLADDKTIRIRLGEGLSMQKVMGAPFPVGMNVTYSNKNPETRIAVVFFDLSIEKRIDDLKDAFLSSMQHQISTPFSIVKWNIELLEQEEEELKKIGVTKNSIISETRLAIDRINQIQNNILTVSRLEQGFFPKEVDVVKPIEIVEETLKHLYLNIKRKKISIKTNYGEGIKDINANKTLMSIVVDNVISNAIKYSPAEETILIDVSQENNQVLFKVKDKGIGIPSKEQEHVFDKFFRSETAMKKSYEGTGLGLYITKILVSYLQGEITFESEEGAGTTFYVKIPNSPKISNVKRDVYKLS